MGGGEDKGHHRHGGKVVGKMYAGVKEAVRRWPGSRRISEASWTAGLEDEVRFS